MAIAATSVTTVAHQHDSGYNHGERHTIVTQSAVQAGGQHQTLVHNLLNLIFVRLDTDDAVLGEAPGTIRQESDGLQEVLDENGLENVKLELAV